MEDGGMKRQWYETLDERKRQMREKQGKSTDQGRLLSLSEVNKRKPYHCGAKAYLTSFEIGEERIFDGTFLYNSLRSIASRLHRDYGVQYSFKITNGIRKVRRLA